MEYLDIDKTKPYWTSLFSTHHQNYVVCYGN